MTAEYQANAFPRANRVPWLAATVAAAFLISGCSSKNPDSLIGMNVDENLAVMDANETSDANAAATADHAATNASSADAEHHETGSAVANSDNDTIFDPRSGVADARPAGTMIEDNESDADHVDENESQPPQL